MERHARTLLQNLLDVDPGLALSIQHMILPCRGLVENIEDVIWLTLSNLSFL